MIERRRQGPNDSVSAWTRILSFATVSIAAYVLVVALFMNIEAKGVADVKINYVVDGLKATSLFLLILAGGELPRVGGRLMGLRGKREVGAERLNSFVVAVAIALIVGLSLKILVSLEIIAFSGGLDTADRFKDFLSYGSTLPIFMYLAINFWVVWTNRDPASEQTFPRQDSVELARHHLVLGNIPTAMPLLALIAIINLPFVGAADAVERDLFLSGGITIVILASALIAQSLKSIHH